MLLKYWPAANQRPQKMLSFLTACIVVALIVPFHKASADNFANIAEPFFQSYCYRCHSADEKTKGDVDLKEFASDASITKDRDMWLDILYLVETEEMPTKEPLPTAAERAAFVEWLDSKVNSVDWSKVKHAGYVPMPRLTKKEYNNTMRDLLGVDVQPGHILFEDGEGNSGFTTDRSNLFLSPAAMEKYIEAADKALDAVIGGIEPISKTFEAENMLSTANIKALSSSLRGGGEGVRLTIGQTTMYESLEVPADGTYIIELRGQSANADNGSALVRLNNEPVGLATFPGEKASVQELSTFIPKGAHQLTINKGIDARRIIKDGNKTFLKEVVFDWIKITGPVSAMNRRSNKPRYSLQPKPGISEVESVREMMIQFLVRAFRRPIKPSTLEKYVDIFKNARAQGAGYTYSLRQTMLAAMVSPRFLYRHEFGPSEDGTREEYALDDFQIASRLSYFLWLSMPDDELFKLASQRKLRDPEVLRSQVKRMLADPKSRDFSSTFLGQWLKFEALGKDVIPDSKTFPEYNKQLSDAMKAETILTFEHLIAKDYSILTLIDSRATFLNEVLAKHYGIDGVEGNHMRPVRLEDPHRGGLLGMGSILTATSTPTRTSPVIRGIWVKENLLGERIPEAPADVPEIDEKAGIKKKTTLREELQIHRDNPDCARCHDKIDPIGFGLENFDGIGRFRTKEFSGVPIDSRGEMEGFSFEGAAELKAWLMKHRKDQFVHTVSKNMLAYALGREIESFDEPAISKITKALAENDYKASILIQEVVLSYPFLNKSNSNEVNPHE
ncbi:DUF1592 domain-containing protein [Rubritalea spongiae]|uniref:DUF1592 domain-containing protein n=1 Tax=Rubritalea spongiae TaxID=430797 RepID=A0ABW5E7A3_9BACT